MTADPLRNRSPRAVFLCYHSIHPGGPPFVSVAPDAFERQLALLARLGFRRGGVAELRRLAAGAPPRGRLAFPTFDDGYLDNHDLAAPMLEAQGFRGLFFLLPPLVDRGGAMDWPRAERDRREHPAVMRSLDWPMAERLAAAGHELGSHTLAHHDLTSLDGERLRQELLDSRRRIEDRLGACRSLAYPFGRWSAAVARAAADAGYEFAFTLPYGGQLRASRMSIPRIPVDHRDGERRFRLKLSAAYRTVLLSPLKPAARRLTGRRPRHLARPGARR